MSTWSDVERWARILEQQMPEYIELKIVLERGPKIIADLCQKGKQWCITLQEQPSPVSQTPIWTNPGKLDERVDWAIAQLKAWPDVKRMAHDMWYFKRKSDAEKFKTLYNLRWDQ